MKNNKNGLKRLMAYLKDCEKAGYTLIGVGANECINGNKWENTTRTILTGFIQGYCEKKIDEWDPLPEAKYPKSTGNWDAIVGIVCKHFESAMPKDGLEQRSCGGAMNVWTDGEEAGVYLLPKDFYQLRLKDVESFIKLWESLQKCTEQIDRDVFLTGLQPYFSTAMTPDFFNGIMYYCVFNHELTVESDWQVYYRGKLYAMPNLQRYFTSQKPLWQFKID